MQTQTGRCVTGAAPSVRMLELKSSMKGIVCWYFSWPAPLVRSRKPRPFELGLTCFGCGLDHVIGSKQQLDSEEETLFSGGLCLIPFSASLRCPQSLFPRSLHVSVQMQTMSVLCFYCITSIKKILHQFWKKKELKCCKNISVY